MNISNSSSMPDTSDADVFNIADELCTIEPIPFTHPSSNSYTSSYIGSAKGLEELFMSVHSSYAHQSEQPSQRYAGDSHEQVNVREFTRTSDLHRNVHSNRALANHSSAAATVNTEPVMSKEEARRHKSRESAAKSRRRAHETIRALEDALTVVQQRHAFLSSELERLTALRLEQQQHRAPFLHYTT